MNRGVKTAGVALLVLVAACGGYLLGHSRARSVDRDSGADFARAPAQSPTAGLQVYTCSMHPHVRLAQPGNCPICEMPLIPAAPPPGPGAAPGAGAGVSPGAMLQLSDHALAMASVETVAVERRLLSRQLRAVGRIEYNESSLATITPRVDGYAERLFVNFTGVEIRKGDHLVEVYSPELLVAQQELLIALHAGAGGALADVAKSKLRLLGLTDEQITNLVEKRQTTDRVTLYSPISGTVIEKGIVEKAAFKAGDALYRIANLDSVWVYLEIYEYDLPWVRYGQTVRLTAQAVPGRTLEGLVTFVQPIVNEQTRTIRVPVHVDNLDHVLKPGMFVTAVIDAVLTRQGRAAPTGVEGRFSCPMHPQVLADAEGECPICQMPLEEIPVEPHEATAPPGAGATASAVGRAEEKPSSQTARQPNIRTEPAVDQHAGHVDQPGAGPAPGPDPTKTRNIDETPGSESRATAEPAATGYFCPMKCEGDKTYELPGRCPVCNMQLKKVAAPEEETDDGAGVLAVPVSAVLDSGTHQIVYVEKSRGLFEPRELTLGPRAGDYFAVLSGLSPGERVVTRGNFLIDSQFQVTGQSSLFYPGGLRASTAHQHESNTATPPTSPDVPARSGDTKAQPPAGGHKH